MASFYAILETIDTSDAIGERIKHKLEDIATLDWDANGALGKVMKLTSSKPNLDFQDFVFTEFLALTNTASNIVYIKQLFHEIGTRLSTRDISHYPEVESKCNELILIANYRLQQEQPVIDLLEDLDEISKKIAVLQEDINRVSFQSNNMKISTLATDGDPNFFHI